MTLTKRNRPLRPSQSDDDVIVGLSNGVAVSDTLQKVKDEIRKGTDTIREVKKTVQRPWWRTGRFLFPLGMFGEPCLQRLDHYASGLRLEFSRNTPRIHVC